MLKFGNTYLNFGGTYLSKIQPNYNPLNLPPNTVRVRTNDGEPPEKIMTTTYETATLVTGTSDVYDVYKSGTDFHQLLFDSMNVTDVLGANTSDIEATFNMFIGCSSLTSIALFDTSKVTDMHYMFLDCSSLTSVPLFDTSKVTNMYQMFAGCKSLTNVPLLDTSKVTDMTEMFKNCYKVESGALALYQQASSQTNPPGSHRRAFYQCGINTQTGSAELVQIPRDWKY